MGICQSKIRKDLKEEIKVKSNGENFTFKQINTPLGNKENKNPFKEDLSEKKKPLNREFTPFDDNKNDRVDPGEYAPFNVQALTTPIGATHIFVTYAKTQTCPEEEIKIALFEYT